MRSRTGSPRHSASVTSGAASPVLLNWSAISSEPLGRVGSAVEDDVLDAFAQLGVDVVEDDEGPGVDDAHVHAGLDGVVEEDRVDRLAHGVVAPERERDVGDAAGDEGARQVLLDPARRLDEVGAVCRVLLDARGHREDVGVEDDVVRVHADLAREQVVGALTDLLAALEGVGLTLLVEGHDDDGRAVLVAEAGLREERLDALLHRDGVDDRLALGALEAGLDDLPLAGVDHQRHPADVGLARDELDEAVHRGDAVDHPLVHVDVDDLCPGLHLLAGHRQRGRVVLLLDEATEAGRAGDVGALADVDEERVLVDGQRLEPAEAQGPRDLRADAGGALCGRVGNGPDVLRRGPAAAAEDVDEAARRELAHDRGHLVGGLVVLTERVGQAGVRVGRHEAVGDPRELGDVGPQLVGAQGAVEPDDERAGVAHGVPERLGDLTRQRAAGGVGDRPGDDDRPTTAEVLEERLDARRSPPWR